ncbi:hypothetical protein HY837_03130 [archaeon]|nr:hypothetical protein [archaeon]
MGIKDLGAYVLSAAKNYGIGTKDQVENHCNEWFGRTAHSIEAGLLTVTEGISASILSGVSNLNFNFQPSWQLALSVFLGADAVTRLASIAYHEEGYSTGLIGFVRGFRKPQKKKKAKIKGSYDGWLDMDEVAELNKSTGSLGESSKPYKPKGLRGKWTDDDFKKLWDYMQNPKEE